MKDETLISVIIPVYNAERYLAACIESVQRQTHGNLEIILVNDGSNDGSRAICDMYAKEDPRVKVIHQKNQGVSLARGNGVATAAGNYISFVDADDEMREDMLEVLLRLCQGKRCQIAQCAVAKVEVGQPLPHTPALGEMKRYEGEEISRLFFDYKSGGRGGAAGVWNKLAERKLYDKVVFRPLQIAEDEDMVYQLYWYADSLAVTDEVLYYLRQTPSSATRSGYSLKELDYLTMLEGQAAFYREKGATALYGKTLQELCGAIPSKVKRMREYAPVESRELQKRWKKRGRTLLRVLWGCPGLGGKKKLSALLMTVWPDAWHWMKGV